MPPLRLDPSESVLIIVDVQERLFSAMPEIEGHHAVRQLEHIQWLSAALAVPMLRTEQYPAGLGPTLPVLARGRTIEKRCFSCMGQPDFAEHLRGLGKTQIVLAGMETHICVAQTCRDLLWEGLEVVVVADACLSRRTLDHQLGLERMHDDGARPVTAEALLFEWVGDARSPLFKELSRRVR